MLSFTTNKTECTGCSACLAGCPVNCITMQNDEEGFWYPHASNACIKCGKCEKICPVLKPDKTANNDTQSAYACLSKDDKIWRRSASGGAFSEICLAWGDDKTIVVGAAYDGFKVHHVCVEGVENIEPLCKSKYVASNPENTFREIRDYLNQGRKVIFCGVPCQVAGLKSFLLKNYDNLLTIDLICHGVGSPIVFDSAIHALEMQFGGPISSYEFRAKRKHHEEDYLTSITISNKKKYVVKDQYYQLFMQQNCLRPSCGGNCKFRNHNRQGDLTIADFKGLKNVFPQLRGTKRNYSTLVSNNVKGGAVVSLLKHRMIVLDCSIDNIIKYNPLFNGHTWSSKDRDKFFEDFCKDSNAAIKRWTCAAKVYKPSIKFIIYQMLPTSIRKMLSQI